MHGRGVLQEATAGVLAEYGFAGQEMMFMMQMQVCSLQTDFAGSTALRFIL